MPLIVVVEDDDGTRTFVVSVLRKDGYEVAEAADGIAGLALVRERQPDLVVSDVHMPGMDGFQMLAALRADAAHAATPVILLTSLAERAHMRIGMTTGADDYLTKPFRPAELHDAVAAQLNKRVRLAALQSLAVGAGVDAVVGAAVEAAVGVALKQQAEQITHLYEQRLARDLGELPDGAPGAPPPVSEPLGQATALFADIHAYAVWATRLTPAELGELVQQFYRNAGDTVHLFGARHMQFVGEGLVAVFTAEADARPDNHALRAVRAALGLVQARPRVQQYIDTRFAGRDLPRFEVSVALHAGPVMLTALGDPLAGARPQMAAVGDTVSAVMALQRAARDRGWLVAGTLPALLPVASRLKLGRRAQVALPGRPAPLDVAEVLSLQMP